MNVGIDLGTSYSLIATAQGPEPFVVPDSQDPEFAETPSSVYISADGAFVGRQADRMETENPALLRRAFKLRFGEKQALLRAQGQDWFPETLAALLLTKLVRDAGRGRPDVEAAVITVPAHFNPAQRQTVLKAAHLAKLTVLDLFEEPKAAALHYRMQEETQRQTLLVYDFGGGTFDVSVLKLDHGVMQELAKRGVTALGGKNLDTRVQALILAQYAQALGQPIAEEDLSLPDRLKLGHLAERMKKTLTIRDVVNEVLYLGALAPVQIELERQDFESAIQEDIEATINTTLQCLEESKLDRAAVDTVLLVGGSSMVPRVQRRLQEIFNRDGQRVKFDRYTTRAVARGAAIRAGQLSKEAPLYGLPTSIRGVTGWHIGVTGLDPQTQRFGVDTVLQKNTPIDAAQAARTYYTTHRDQDRIVLNIVQYLDTSEDAKTLGTLEMGPFPARPQGYHVEVTFRYQENGTLDVQARNPLTRQPIPRTFRLDGAVDEAHLAQQQRLVQAYTAAWER